MDKTEKVVLTNMCMVYNGSKILVQDRLNPKWPGIAFPGGHVDIKESFVKSTIREVFEETGLKIKNLKLCGIKQWVHKNGLFRYLVFLYKTDCYEGKLKSSEEGQVFWIDVADIDKYVLADTFKEMLKVFIDDDISEDYYLFEEDLWHHEQI